MIRNWTLTIALGVALAFGAAHVSYAQSTDGSNGGFVVPGNSSSHMTGTHNAAVGDGIGSAGAAPQTSLSGRTGGVSVTRESDIPHQIGVLAPAALLLAIALAGGLYFFVFRKSTTEEGDAAANGPNGLTTGAQGTKI